MGDFLRDLELWEENMRKKDEQLKNTFAPVAEKVRPAFVILKFRYLSLP